MPLRKSLLRYLGTGKDLAGAAICLLVDRGFYGESAFAKDDGPFKRAHIRYKTWCSGHGLMSSCPMFTYKSCHAETFAFFDAKAAQIKMVLLFLADETALAVSSELHTDDEIALAAGCFCALAAWIHCLDHAGIILTDRQKSNCLHYGRVHLQMYKALALRAVETGAKRWKVRPKMHYLDHTMREVQSGLNPRFFQCFLDEDYIGKIIRIASRCHRSKISINVLRRYMVLLEQRWSR